MMQHTCAKDESGRMGTNRACPASLRLHSRQIAGLDPGLQTILYSSGAWDKWVGAYDEFQAVAARLPASVSRRDLARLGAETLADRRRLRELFLAAMIFGYGNNGRKYRV